MIHVLKQTTGLLFIVFFAAGAFYFYANAAPLSWTSPPSSVEMHGYAWSDNIGWISFNCDNHDAASCTSYGVTIDSADGSLDGYAWSDNIGWIQFGGLSGFPEGSNGNAYIDHSGSDIYIYGWARALAYGDGWDGWISFNCDDLAGGCASNPDYGSKVIERPTEGGFSTSEPYVWGGDVIGWVTMAGVMFDHPYTPGPYACGHDPEISHSRDMWGDETTTACAVGDVCSELTFQCEALTQPNLGDFSAARPLVRAGESTTITWTVTDADTCTLRGFGRDIGSPGLTGSENSGAINGRVEFELWCVPITLSPAVFVDSLTIQTVSTRTDI